MGKYTIFENELNVYINKENCIKVIYDVTKIFFLGYFDNVSEKEKYIIEKINDIRITLHEEIRKAFLMACNTHHTNEYCLKDTEKVIDEFLLELVKVKDILKTDIDSVYEGDPASFDYNEIIMCYPGLFAILVYRIGHILHSLNVPYLPRMLSEYAHSLTGIDIHPGAIIGHHFFIDHGTGIVIGETAVIGNYVKIYQGVTLGALSIKDASSLRGVKRHPEIKDNVTIYSGASILGGNTVIGKNCVIGSNVFITSSVPDNTTVKTTITQVD